MHEMKLTSGLNTDLHGEEYVYIVPDYVRFENQTDIWMDRTAGALSSGRNQESRDSMQNLLFVSIIGPC
jgi:hypothetical protein